MEYVFWINLVSHTTQNLFSIKLFYSSSGFISCFYHTKPLYAATLCVEVRCKLSKRIIKVFRRHEWNFCHQFSYLALFCRSVEFSNISLSDIISLTINNSWLLFSEISCLPFPIELRRDQRPFSHGVGRAKVRD